MNVKTILVREHYDHAADNYHDFSSNAQGFMDDIEEKLKFAEDEEVEFMVLTEKQLSWLESLANWEEHRSSFRD